MSQEWRTVKVFISSTFRDMQAERDHLVRFVFPRLREELLKRRIHLVGVDLRWGVTSEQDALEVCTQIIDECRPRFLCILGGRYGWTPAGREESITAQEIRYAVLHRLEDKEYRFFYFRDPEVTAAISEAAARAGGYWEFPTREEMSEFGQEEAEMRAQRRTEKLKVLKQDVIAAGFIPCCYPARWDGDQQRLVGLKAFGNQVYDDLLWSVKDEFPYRFTEPLAELDEFAAQNAAMEAFVQERSAGYVVGSRQDLLEKLRAFAGRGGPPNIMALTGAAGSGKSALLAKFYLDYLNSKDQPAYPQDLVIPHFIGASPGSTDLRHTLRRVCHELAQATTLHEEIPQNLRELLHKFPHFLKQAAAARRVVLLIDALNQMDAEGNAHAMNWLPYDLPANVRVIVSSLEHPALKALQRRGKERGRQEELAPLVEADRRAIITGFLERYRKRITGEQIASLLTKTESGNPLYLLTALEELRTLGSYEEIDSRITEIPATARGMFAWIMGRLEGGVEGQEAFGQPLVGSFLSYLAIGRGGMTWAELENLCGPLDPEGKLPILYHLLRPYLMFRGELVDFFHGQLREVVEARYLDDQARQSRHKEVSNYFWRRGYDYPRTISETTYHEYKYALLSGETSGLFSLVDDDTLKRRQFELFGRPEPALTDIGYALDLAVRQSLPTPLVHYAMMRLRLTRAFCRAYLYRLAGIAPQKPDMAKGTVDLIPDPALRRLGLVFLAWLLIDDAKMREFIRELLTTAGAGRSPAKMLQVPLLLEMTKDFYLAGLKEAAALVKVVPPGPLLRLYERAWALTNGPLARLAQEMAQPSGPIPSAGAGEITQYQEIQTLVKEFLPSNRRQTMHPRKFEEKMFDSFGPEGAAGAYFLLAAEKLQSGIAKDAAIFVNRGIFVAWRPPSPALRTLAGLVETLTHLGERDLAEEHADRINTFARAKDFLAKTPEEKDSWEDALSELTIASERLAPSWRPAGTRDLMQQALVEETHARPAKEADPWSLLAHARQMLARNLTSNVPRLLTEILAAADKVSAAETRQALLLSLYTLARAAREEGLVQQLRVQLKDRDLDVEEFLSTHPLPPGSLLLEILVNADNRGVAAAALGLRLGGYSQRLFELTRAASIAGAPPETIDALLSEIIRLPGLNVRDLRQIGDEVLATAKQLEIPSGWGWYYYPGSLLLCLCLGIIAAALGLRAALGATGVLIYGPVLMGAGFLGGLLDLRIWGYIGLWERPERSRWQFWPEMGTLLSFGVSQILTHHFLIQGWAESTRNTLLIGSAVVILPAGLLGYFAARRGYLFSPLSSRLIVRGTVTAMILATLLYTFLAPFLNRLFASGTIMGFFLGGALLLSLALNILPKRQAILNFYRVRGYSEKKEEGSDLFTED